MRKYVYFLGLCLFLELPLALFWGANSFAKESLQNRWNRENRAPKSTYPGSQINQIQNKRIVFVPGLFHELYTFGTGYCDENKKIWKKEFGIKATCLHPPSSRSVIENTVYIKNKIQKIYHKSNQSIVLLGHSKGAAEVLHTVLRYPELIDTQMVDKVILIQGAIQGSPLADETLGGVSFRMIDYFLRQGIHSMTLEQAQESLNASYGLFQSYLRNYYPWSYKDEKRRVSDQVFYVRSYEESGQWSWGLRNALRLLGRQLPTTHRSDGMVNTEDQKWDRFGVDLGVVQADHADLMMRRPSSGYSYGARRSFFRAIFSKVYSEKNKEFKK